MTEKDRQHKDYSTVLVRHWIDKAQDDLDSAQMNFQSGRLSNAVRDIYFACFHVVSALFMKEGKTFKKHSQVRAILDQANTFVSEMQKLLDTKSVF
jgi:uncharacterized protein (UPF0332 family)